MSTSHGTRRPRNVGFVPASPRATAPRPVGRRSGARRAALPSGAIRLDAASAATTAATSRVRHLGKLSAALVLISAGILLATRSTGSVPPARAPSTPTPPSAANAPTLFFDDAENALGERFEGPAPDVAPLRTVAAANLSATEPRRPSAETGARAAGADPQASGVSGAASGTGTTEADDPAIASIAAPKATPPLAPPGKGDGALAPSGVPDPKTPEQAEPLGGPLVRELVVAPGDTLSGILNDNGLSRARLVALLGDELVQQHLGSLRVGQALAISHHPDGRFRGLTTRAGNNTRVSVDDDGGTFRVSATELPIEKERVVTSGTIEQSLYMAAEQADLKQSTIMTLADIFQWELDFARDIRKGDNFAIVYDRLYREGEYIGDGDILAAEFERGGRAHRAIRFVAADGTTGYYAPDGSSKRRTFTRHPVDVVRITSKFDPERLHPVLHQIRAHRGVDYGSPHGSPIRATADGVVSYAGERGSYGNTVILRHGEHTETLYAHMSRISDKSVGGRRVEQGDVIGYVGRTGRVTGTHLHYEFRVDGKHVDPLTVELPAAAPIDPSEREALRDLSDGLLAQMRSVLESSDGSLARVEDAALRPPATAERRDTN